MPAASAREPGSHFTGCHDSITGKPCHELSGGMMPVHRVVVLLAALLDQCRFDQPTEGDPANVIIIHPLGVRLHTAKAFQVARWLYESKHKGAKVVARRLMSAAMRRDLGAAFEPGRDYLK